MRKNYSITLHLNYEEMRQINALIEERGFSNRGDFFRACINAYADRYILKGRTESTKPKKTRIRKFSWNFEGGHIVVDQVSITVHFDEMPDMDMRSKLRFMHYVRIPDTLSWKVIKNSHTNIEARKLFPKIE